MEIRTAPDSIRYADLHSQALREAFLVESLFVADTIDFVYYDVDRAVIGSAVPGKDALMLSTAPELRSTYFTERRELGILNIGAAGDVAVGDKMYRLDPLDCLYIGRGNPNVSFRSVDAANPAKFYLLSYPAHAAYPMAHAKKAEALATPLGGEATSNKRTIYKYIHTDGIKSCQLVMGFTELAEGSVWNTMPPHTHMRRSEVYLYFGLAADSRVFHLMGTPQETRHLVVGNEQVVVSPPWSIHSGAGTANYAFCWGMGGENQDFGDMDGVPVGQLR